MKEIAPPNTKVTPDAKRNFNHRMVPFPAELAVKLCCFMMVEYDSKFALECRKFLGIFLKFISTGFNIPIDYFYFQSFHFLIFQLCYFLLYSLLYPTYIKYNEILISISRINCINGCILAITLSGFKLTVIINIVIIISKKVKYNKFIPYLNTLRILSLSKSNTIELIIIYILKFRTK